MYCCINMVFVHLLRLSSMPVLAALLWLIFTPVLYPVCLGLRVSVLVLRLSISIASWIEDAKVPRGEVPSLASALLLQYSIISAPWRFFRSLARCVRFLGSFILLYSALGFLFTMISSTPAALLLGLFSRPLWLGLHDWEVVRGILPARTRHALLVTAVFVVDLYYECAQGEWRRETDASQPSFRNRTLFVALDFVLRQTWALLRLWTAPLSWARRLAHRSAQAVETVGLRVLTSPHVPSVARLWFAALVLITAHVKDGLEKLVIVWTARMTQPVHDAGSTVYDTEQDAKRQQNQNIYAPLTSSAASIRILSVHPGDQCQPLHCSIHAAPRSSAKYEALSYVWGDPTLERFIFIAGTKFYIAKNLYDCLMHLRHSKDQRELWVDALCINQADPEERSEQVLRMGDLYSKAERVVIWIGLGAPGTAEIFDQTGEGEDSRRPPDTRDSDAIRYLFSSPWWSRVWTVQELVLGNSVIVQCGKHSLSWETFCHVMDTRIDWNNLSQSTLSNVEALVNTFYAEYLALKRERQGRLRGVPRRYPLLERTYTFREKQATVAVDKIFGFYGLLEDASAEIRPDYVEHYSTVQASFAIDFINRYKSLAVVALAELSTPDQDTGIWNWYPRWRVSGKTSAKTLFWTGLGDEVAGQPWSEDAFDACGGRPVRNEYRNDWQTYHRGIALEGYCVDTVVAASRTMTSQGQVLGRPGSVLEQWLAVAQDGTTDSTAHHHWPRLQLFYRTITAGLWDQEQSPGSPDHVKYVTTVREACRGRRFFRTSSDRVGLGPQDATPGDQVWVLLGMGVPVILGQRSSPERWGVYPCRRYLGQAYVDDLMNARSSKHAVQDPGVLETVNITCK